MGISVAVGDLDNDDYAEVLTGRYERYSPDSEFAPGRAHLFWGSYLAAHAPSSSGGHTLIVPPEAELASSGITYDNSSSSYPPAYQTLFDPAATDGDWFGWIVYVFDYDLGGPGFGDSDWRRDIAVHAEDTNGTDGVNVFTGEGCLTVFLGNSNEAENSLVEAPYGVRLQLPSNTGESQQQGDRFGRMAVDMPWLDTNGDPINTLWVAATDHTFHATRTGAGGVVCFKAPLDGEGGTDNSWGTFVLKEVADNVAEKQPNQLGVLIDDDGVMDDHGGSVFGAWMTRLHYSDDLPGEQIAVSARDRTLGGEPKVGQVYTFYPDDQ
jgi:hypothetical protein